MTTTNQLRATQAGRRAAIGGLAWLLATNKKLDCFTRDRFAEDFGGIDGGPENCARR